MGFLDALMGRSKPAQPDLDRLFAVPSAAVTLQARAGFAPTGRGSVCFKAAEGQAFADTQRDVRRLLDADQGPPVEQSTDTYGFTWLALRHSLDSLDSSDSSDSSDAVANLVTEVHAVNTSLVDAGFGRSLLCSLFGFADEGGRRLALVYLYKRGTFYLFAPQEGERRDNALELQVRAQLEDDLRIERDLSRWFPVWGAPGL